MPKKLTVAFLAVDQNGVLEPVPPIRAAPGTTVMFVMTNDHPTDDFKVEFKDFKRKETMAAALPIEGPASHFRTLSAGETETVKVKTKAAASFGSGVGLLPYTTYKYSVAITNQTAGTPTVLVDPDYDVPPP
jgi:hypothetical protein